MNLHLAMGIFALYVFAVSLLRLLSCREIPRLTAMKRAWGRNRGLLAHFLSSVALPLVLGIVFMSRGIVGVGTQSPVAGRDISWQAAICALTAPANVPTDSCPAADGADDSIAVPADRFPHAPSEPVTLPWHLPAP